MNIAINKILQQKLSRRDFLKTVGVGAVAMVGLSAIVPSLGRPTNLSHVTSGYGSGRYVSRPNGR